ncbi:hypothetical protein ASD64_09330 [Mesorhizobium sp. Root157]|nr:hypothetical protein ASD64_09330 [Mesorhizobium sp. Root157]
MIAFLHTLLWPVGHLPFKEQASIALPLSLVSNAAGHASTSQPPVFSLEGRTACGLKGIFR